jgi:hypothetical protein
MLTGTHYEPDKAKELSIALSATVKNKVKGTRTYFDAV